MTEERLKTLCDVTTEAHTRIQKDFANIDPIVGVSQKMREGGVPADAMTIDCLKTGRRIIVILTDAQPDLVHYQFSYKDKDPDDAFFQIPFSDLNNETMYTWMRDYFSVPSEE